MIKISSQINPPLLFCRGGSRAVAKRRKKEFSLFLTRKNIKKKKIKKKCVFDLSPERVERESAQTPPPVHTLPPSTVSNAFLLHCFSTAAAAAAAEERVDAASLCCPKGFCPVFEREKVLHLCQQHQ
jgi:hypothetical protein